MASSAHPLTRSTTAIRLREHTLLDIEELIDADAFSLDGDEVTFTRRPRGSERRRTWHGRLGDWLVSDGADYWRIVSDHDLGTAEAALLGDSPAR